MYDHDNLILRLEGDDAGKEVHCGGRDKIVLYERRGGKVYDRAQIAKWLHKVHG